MSIRKPSEIPNLIAQLRSVDADERRSAARFLGRLYAESGPHDPPLIEIARMIGDVNDVSADTVAPFVREFTNPLRNLESAWLAQTGAPVSEWIFEMLCRQPDVEEEFAAYGLADTARDFLNGSPEVVRRILRAGKVWRAFIVATGGTMPSEENKSLMEDFAIVDNLAVASRATFGLAGVYQVLHPRAAARAWILPQTIDNFQLFWCRGPDEQLPHRVWSWRTDFRHFTIMDANSVIEKVVYPSQLGKPHRQTTYGEGSQSFDYERFRVNLDPPPEFDEFQSVYSISTPSKTSHVGRLACGKGNCG